MSKKDRANLAIAKYCFSMGFILIGLCLVMSRIS